MKKWKASTNRSIKREQHMMIIILTFSIFDKLLKINNSLTISIVSKKNIMEPNEGDVRVILYNEGDL